MNTNRRRKQNGKQKQHTRQQKRRIIISIASLLVAMVLSINSNQGLALAEHDVANNTQYTSIEIKAGENLWSIAEQYKANEQSTYSYIAELKQINNFESDNIYEGDYLIVIDYTL